LRLEAPVWQGRIIILVLIRLRCATTYPADYCVQI